MNNRDDGWDSAWNDEETMTDREIRSRNDHAENAKWQARLQRMNQEREKNRLAADVEQHEKQAKAAAESRRFKVYAGIFLIVLVVVILLLAL